MKAEFFWHGFEAFFCVNLVFRPDVYWRACFETNSDCLLLYLSHAAGPAGTIVTEGLYSASAEHLPDDLFYVWRDLIQLLLRWDTSFKRILVKF